MSSFTDVWWHPHHIEYAFSLIRPQQWPGYVPILPLHGHDLTEHRQYYNDPVDTEDRLLYRRPIIGVPTNRDVLLHQPDLCPTTRPPGFHGRNHYKDGAPEFVHEGPLRDDLYWYERNTYQPKHEDPRLLSTKEMTIPRNLDVSRPPRHLTDRRHQRAPSPGREPYTRFQRLKLVDDFKRMTQDGVGCL